MPTREELLAKAAVTASEQREQQHASPDGGLSALESARERIKAKAVIMVRAPIHVAAAALQCGLRRRRCTLPADNCFHFGGRGVIGRTTSILLSVLRRNAFLLVSPPSSEET